jgi:putative hydrolase of the HAD superfamily
VTRAYRVVLFDLFGTVVHFDPAPGPGRATFEWLRAPLAEQRPAVSFDEFRRALLEISSAIIAERTAELREVPSHERFRRTLARVGASADGDAAETLSLAHMAHLAAQTTMPAAHRDLLGALGESHRLGLVSNFDHSPTAQAILDRHRISSCFEVALISDDFGQRKPHPAIFREALRRIDAVPEEALYVGDTPADDIVGARAAGLDVAWINRGGDAQPDPAPSYTVRELTELRKILG